VLELCPISIELNIPPNWILRYKIYVEFYEDIAFPRGSPMKKLRFDVLSKTRDTSG
jgi:hypothetical protein